MANWAGQNTYQGSVAQKASAAVNPTKIPWRAGFAAANPAPDPAMDLSKEVGTVNGRTYNAAGQYLSGAAGGQDQSSAALSAAQIAAQQEAARVAAEEAQKGQYRQNITGLIDQALGVYDTLFGNVRGAATSQRQALEGRYNKETGSLTDQFNAELPKIGMSYAGRGAYDSTYRMGAEAEAGKQFQNQLDTVKSQYESDKAKIGQELLAQEANIGTGKSLLDLTKSRLGEVTDLGELMATQNEINRKIAELRGTAQSTGTQEAYMAKFGELAPAADRMATLQTQLSTIINGQAPAALKRAVATQIVGSAGLPKEQEDQLTNIINTQIG